MPTLDDKNTKSVIKDIPKKGFTAKFWQDHRSGFCSGSGVAKMMNKLKAYNIPPSGDPSNASMMEMEAIVETYGKLYEAMGKAESKCTKLQSHTKQLCAAYMKEIRRLEAVAVTLIKNADKVEARKEQAKKDEAKEFAKFKDERDKTRGLVLKELEKLDTQARKVTKACESIQKDVSLATVDLKKLTAALDGQLDGSGKVAPELLSRFEKGLVSLQKKYNVPIHAQNLKNSLPKIFKELTGAFPQYSKLDYAKEERMSTASALKAAQEQLRKADRTFKTYAEFHQAMAAMMNGAK